MKPYFLLAATLLVADSCEAAPKLPEVPKNLPAWLTNKDTNHLYPKRGIYNYGVYAIPALARDLNAVAVGHAMAYEDLVTGKGATLETATFSRINNVLNHPPKFKPDESSISPTFGRRYGVLEQVFDWAHVLHDQTVDVLASDKMTNSQKDAEIDRLWKFYFDSVPYAVSPLPMNMAVLDSQPYSGAFRKAYPKVNGLFWGYHWLQGTMYDALLGLTPAQQRASYKLIGKRYHEVELYKVNRAFMPMFAETSPRFALRFPGIANAFDNLHMLHDMVNDILATPGLTETQRGDQIKRAIWMVSAQAHKDCRPGANTGSFHDHRFFDGMPGMGLMPGATTELMNMEGMGWMSFADCHHCSMALPKGEDAWRTTELWADGNTMRLRCALCARDMSAQTKGAAILRIPLESPDKSIVVYGDEEGNLTTDTPQVLFLEEEAGHVRCQQWSRAFSSRAAFDVWAKDNPAYENAKLLTFAEWAQREGKEPDTFVKPEPPTLDKETAKQVEGQMP